MKKISKIVPVLVLFAISPIIAELLMGSTPVSRASQLIMEALYYGPAAVLIREIARRRNLGWISVIMMGITFGILEECLTLQSVFNPDFLHNNLTFGRSLGVNWIWGMCIIGYHAIWSISIPIFFTELLFPKKKFETWLNKTGLIITTGLFILSSIAFYLIFYKLSEGFTSSIIHKIIAVIIALIFFLLSIRLPASPEIKKVFNRTPAFLTGILSFVWSLCWLGLLLLVFKPNWGLNPLFAVFTGIVLVMAAIFILFSWPSQNWSEKNQFFLASGCLYASMLWGLMTVSINKIDFIFQIAFIVIVTVLVSVLKSRINHRMEPDRVKDLSAFR